MQNGCLALERVRVTYERIRRGLREGELLVSERMLLFVCVMYGGWVYESRGPRQTL